MTVVQESPRLQTTTLFEVERDTRWRIWKLFGLLVVVVWACLAPLTLLLALLPNLEQRGTAFSIAYWAYPGLRPVDDLRVAGTVIALMLAIGVLIAVIAWLSTRVGARSRLLRALRAVPLDSSDSYHRRLANVVDEVRIGAGLGRLDVVVLRALTINAVSFSDREGDCIGVTEGALSRLSRPQLQAVVAHEVAHLVSRDCVVATRACLLFMGVRRIADTYGKGLTIAVLGGCAGFCYAMLMPVAPVQIGVFWGLVGLLIWGAVWLAFWTAAAGGTFVNLAMSRQREFAADVGSVGFTKDPAALAEALQMIEWQSLAPSGVPRALAPLAIAPAGVQHTSGWRRHFDTHPPLSDRIQLLEALAHQRGQTLWERRTLLKRRLEAREHATPPRAVQILRERPEAAERDLAQCPRCGNPMHRLVYEGTPIIECTICAGLGAASSQVEAILARRDWGFTPQQERIADVIERYQSLTNSMAERDAGRRRPPLSLPWPTELSVTSTCPHCERPMRRVPWSLAYPLPVDVCDSCDFYWFDRDELEVLQILVERQTT